MMIIQGTIELRYNIRSTWFLDIRISTCYSTHESCNTKTYQHKLIGLSLAGFYFYGPYVPKLVCTVP